MEWKSQFGATAQRVMDSASMYTCSKHIRLDKISPRGFYYTYFSEYLLTRYTLF